MELHPVSWIHGRRPVEELLKSERPVLRVWISPRLGTAHRKEFELLCKRRGIDLQHAPDAKLALLCGSGDHQGAVAKPSEHAILELGQLLAMPESDRKVVFALDGVENPRNLGLIARTLVAAGCPVVLLPSKGGALPDQSFLEASAGYGNRLVLVRVGKLVPALEELKKAGYWVYGLDAHGKRGLFGHELADKTVFVMGNETDGMRPTVKNALDETLSVPLAPGVDSLNVAVTAALCAFEAVRSGRVSLPPAPASTGTRNTASTAPGKAAPPPPKR